MTGEPILAIDIEADAAVVFELGLVSGLLMKGLLHQPTLRYGIATGPLERWTDFEFH